MFRLVYIWFIYYINRKRLLTFWWSVFVSVFVCFDQSSINIHFYTAISALAVYIYNGERFTILGLTSIRSIKVSWCLVSYVERSAIETVEHRLRYIPQKGIRPKCPTSFCF